MRRAAPADALLARILDRRARAGAAYFPGQAERIARLCHGMAERFARGGRLLAVGRSPAARSDARHVAVEFVHPVIVGKRALPALALTAEGGPLGRQVRLIARPDDIAIVFGAEDGEPETLEALAVARERGCLTIALADAGADWDLPPPSDDPFVRQELGETLYHVLWELVHVFFEHAGLLEGRTTRRVHDAGRSSFLYPFLAEQETDLESVIADVRASVLLKAEEVEDLRARTLAECTEEILGAAALLRERLEAGGTVLALGNGGSATDAMDLVADLRDPPHGWPARPGLDLTEDTSIITAVANDVGVEAIFARQVIAYGGAGDVLVALSTSGNSTNVIAALVEARRRGLATVALVGYDGGRVLSEGLADRVVVSPSEHIPRIQEAQATVLHALRELIERPG